MDACVCGRPGTERACDGGCGTVVCGNARCRTAAATRHSADLCAAIRETRRLGPDRCAGPWHAVVWAAERNAPRVRVRTGAVVELSRALDLAVAHAAFWGHGSGLCTALLDAARTTLRTAPPPQNRLERRRAVVPGMGDGLFVGAVGADAGCVLLAEAGLGHHSASEAARVLALLATVPDAAERARLCRATDDPDPMAQVPACLPPTFLPRGDCHAALRAARDTAFTRRGPWPGSCPGDCLVAHFSVGRLLNHACGRHANAAWGWHWMMDTPARQQRLGPPAWHADVCLPLGCGGGGWPVGALCVVAKRPIPPGEEVLIDYFAEPDGGPPVTVARGFPFDCRCPACRPAADHLSTPACHPNPDHLNSPDRP